MSKCTYRKGLISLKDCGEPAEAYCMQCNRPVCRKHSKPTPHGSLCLECHAQSNTPKKEDDTWIPYQRRRYYHSSGFYPFYYGHRHRYGDEDYRYFEPQQAQEQDQTEALAGSGLAEEPGEPGEPDMDMDDEMDADDFQDS